MNNINTPESNLPLSKQITCGLYAERDTLDEALEYAQLVLGKSIGAMTPVFVVLNTVAKEVEKLEHYNAKLEHYNANLHKHNAKLEQRNADLDKVSTGLRQRIANLLEMNANQAETFQDLTDKNRCQAKTINDQREVITEIRQDYADQSKHVAAQALKYAEVCGLYEQNLCDQRSTGVTPKRLDKITAALDIAQHHIAEHMHPFADESVEALSVLVKAQKALNKIAAANGIVPATQP